MQIVWKQYITVSDFCTVQLKIFFARGAQGMRLWYTGGTANEERG